MAGKSQETQNTEDFTPLHLIPNSFLLAIMLHIMHSDSSKWQCFVYK